ncbi:MAG: RsfS/YbeB/iojap family protein, partial [Planctomycetes bacterium]|nr:RsfS/YbeB/iojap family protein [Planctomycetota bacterium]
ADEGLWVLMDFGSVVLHIMMRDARAYYDLDNYWGDAPEVTLEPIAPRAA